MNCKNCRHTYQSYHCMDCSSYQGNFVKGSYHCMGCDSYNGLKMSIEKIDEWHRGAYLNAKISFRFKDVVLDDDLLKELGELIACTWNADDIYKTKSRENAICLIIDQDWWDDSYDAGIKENVEREMVEDAQKIFLKQVIRNNCFI